MKKIIWIMGIIGVVFCPPVAEAFLKFDAGASASKAVTTVNNFLESAKKKMDESVAIQTVITYGKGGVEAAKQIKEVKDKAEEKVNDFKEDPLSAGLDLADEGLQEFGGEKYNEISEKIEEKSSKVQEVTDLKRQKEKLEKELSEKLAAEQTAIEGKISVLEKNNQNLQKQIEENPSQADEYRKQIEENNASLAKYKAQLSLASQEINAESLKQIGDLDSQMKKLNGELQAYAEKQKAKVTEELENKLMSFDSEGSLEETTSKNFISEDDVESAQAIIRQKAYRNYVSGHDTLNAFSRAVLTQTELNDDNIETGKIADRAGAVDGSVAAINMETQVKVQNVKAVAKLVEMMILDLKTRTSSEMAETEIYSITKDDDIASFNFDKYISKADAEKEKENK